MSSNAQPPPVGAYIFAVLAIVGGLMSALSGKGGWRSAYGSGSHVHIAGALLFLSGVALLVWLERVRRKARAVRDKEEKAMRMGEFHIAAILVTAQSAFGFWRFEAKSPALLGAAVVASITITVGVWLKWQWARVVAMLIALFSIVGDALAINDGAVADVLALRIVLSVAVLYSMSRTGVKAQFRSGAKRAGDPES